MGGLLLSDRELLGRLVAFDSTSSNSNLPIAGFICSYLDTPGVRIDRNPSDDGRKANIVARRADGNPDAGLTLSGHMDTVPALESGWSSSPFSLTDSGDTLTGRGTADMKGFLAVAMNAFLRASPRSTLALLFTYDEEVGTLGAHHFVESWRGDPLPRRAIIGEPTSLRVVRMHKGHAKAQIVCRGRGAHSGYPHLGHNAIEIAGRVIGELSHLRGALEIERPAYHEFFPDVPFVPINVGTIRGGTAINIVPDHCEIEIGVRPLPGMRTEEIIQRVRDAVARVAGPDEATLEISSDSPPMLLEAKASIHSTLCDIVGQTGSFAVNFATDAGWLQQIGMECVLFGPGTIEVAHRANESVPKGELAAAARVLDRAIGVSC